MRGNGKGDFIELDRRLNLPSQRRKESCLNTYWDNRELCYHTKLNNKYHDLQ